MLDDFNRLVHLVYQAAFDPGLWPDFLLKMSSYMGGTMMVMQGHDVLANASLGALHTPVDPTLMAQYEQYYAARNVWVEGIAKMPVGKAGHPEDHLPYQDYIQSEFYNDWMKPLGDYGTASGIVLHRDLSRFLILSGNVRLKEADAIRMPLAHLLDMLAPHISRSFKMMRHLPGELAGQDYRSSAELAVDPLYFIDRRGCVTYSNGPGDTLTLAETLLRVGRDGRLHWLDLAADGAFGQALGAVVEKNYGRLHGEFSARATDGRVFSATLAPLRPRARAEPSVFDQIFEDLPVAVLLLRAPKIQTAAAGFAREFGLTATELALAQAIASGLSPQDVADRRGVSINTVRTQLKSVYSKTGLHRQSQLAAMFRPDAQ